MDITFQAKKISVQKDFKDYENMESIISHMLDKNEEAIRQYLARYVYTSSISSEINEQLQTIFNLTRQQFIPGSHQTAATT